MSGHGWVTPNPDGMKARCGGPALCSACALEKVRADVAAAGEPPGAAIRAAVAEEIARAIEQSMCEPGEQCAARFCPDCTRYAQCQADAALARRIGSAETEAGIEAVRRAGLEAWDKHHGGAP